MIMNNLHGDNGYPAYSLAYLPFERGRPHITSSRRGGGGVLGLMTIDDEGEGGGFIDVMTSSVYLLKPMAQQSYQ